MSKDKHQTVTQVNVKQFLVEIYGTNYAGMLFNMKKYCVVLVWLG